jgi:KRAB domain-containing zinc finger protein
MKRHVASVHEEKKPFKCDIYDFSCAQRNVLKVHVASVHEGDKPFNCDITAFLKEIS